MQPTIKSLPAFSVAGLKYRGPEAANELPKLWERFNPRMKEIPHRLRELPCYGVMRDYDEASGHFDYLAAVEVSGDGQLPDDMESWQLPAQTYAVFPCTLPTLMEAYQQAHEWQANSGYQRAPGPEFEYYGEDWGDSQKMYLYIPIIEK